MRVWHTRVYNESVIYGVHYTYIYKVGEYSRVSRSSFHFCYKTTHNNPRLSCPNKSLGPICICVKIYTDILHPTRNTNPTTICIFTLNLLPCYYFPSIDRKRILMNARLISIWWRKLSVVVQVKIGLSNERWIYLMLKTLFV